MPKVIATIEFYEKAFGFIRGFVHPSAMYAELNTGATTLAFADESMRELNGIATLNNRFDNAKPAGIELAFSTADVAGAFTRAVAAGCAALKDPMVKPWGQTVAYVRDHNGVLIELCSPIK